MKKYLYITLGFIVLSQLAYGQKLIYSQKEEIAISLPDFKSKEYLTEIDSESKLPESIQKVIKKHLKHRIIDHYKNFKFYKASLFDLKKYYSENPERVYSNLSIIPKIGIIYIWTDLNLGIENFPVVLSLDEYGQVLNFTFPDLSLYNSQNLVSLDKAKILSDSILSQKDFDYKLIHYVLEYDEKNKSLDWNLSYEVNKTNDNKEIIHIQTPITEEDNVTVYKHYLRNWL